MSLVRSMLHGAERFEAHNNSRAVAFVRISGQFVNSLDVDVDAILEVRFLWLLAFVASARSFVWLRRNSSSERTACLSLRYR